MRHLVGFFAIVVLGLLPGRAMAVPVLQLYVQGGTYNTTTETWELNTTGTFNLWVIGNVDGPGGDGTIFNVKLAAAYDMALAGNVDISLTPTTTNEFGGFADPSTPTAPTFNGEDTSGDPPTMSGPPGPGSLPPHSIYGDDTAWQEFVLGDFNLTDSHIADFSGPGFPTELFANAGQINVYTVSITGVPLGGSVHFDAYDTVVRGNNLVAVNVPPSHDAEVNLVPEPSTIAMTFIGLFGSLGVAGVRRWRRRSVIELA